MNFEFKKCQLIQYTTNNSFNGMETMVSPRETSVPLSGKANDLLLSVFYLLNSTSKLAPSLQLNCKTVCFLSEEITLQKGVSSTFIALLSLQSQVFHYWHFQSMVVNRYYVRCVSHLYQTLHRLDRDTKPNPVVPPST